jgi:hypothetical protein
MSKSPLTARDLLDSTASPTDHDPLVVVVLYGGLTVACVLALGATVSILMMYLDTPALFALALLVGFPIAFALPGILLRRIDTVMRRSRN